MSFIGTYELDLKHPEANPFTLVVKTPNVRVRDETMTVIDIKDGVHDLEDFINKRYKAKITNEGRSITFMRPAISKYMNKSNPKDPSRIRDSHSTQIAAIQNDQKRKNEEITVFLPDGMKCNNKHFNGDSPKIGDKLKLNLYADKKKVKHNGKKVKLHYFSITMRVVITGTEKEASVHSSDDSYDDIKAEMEGLSLSDDSSASIHGADNDGDQFY